MLALYCKFFLFFQTHVIFPHLVVSNDPAYFPEPKRFLPERWLKQSAADAGELVAKNMALKHVETL